MTEIALTLDARVTHCARLLPLSGLASVTAVPPNNSATRSTTSRSHIFTAINGRRFLCRPCGLRSPNHASPSRIPASHASSTSVKSKASPLVIADENVEWQCRSGDFITLLRLSPHPLPPPGLHRSCPRRLGGFRISRRQLRPSPPRRTAALPPSSCRALRSMLPWNQLRPITPLLRIERPAKKSDRPSEGRCNCGSPRSI